MPPPLSALGLAFALAVGARGATTPPSLGARRAAHVQAHAKQCQDALALYPPTESARALGTTRVTTRAIATGGGGGDRGVPVGVLSTNEPVFSRDACEAVIAEAEAEAAAGGGWSTTRHSRHPAADVSLERLPRTRAWLSTELHGCLAPLLSTWFPALLPEPSALRVLDGFVVRYLWEAGQIELPTHRDGSLLTINIALNGDGAFDGGGTLVEHAAERAVAQTGGVIAHASAARHAGAPIRRGVRYILVAFCISAANVEHGRRFLEEGVALAAAGRLGEAEATLRAAIGDDPSLQAAHFNLGHVLRAKGQPSRARASYEAALSLDGGLGASRYQEAIIGLASVLPRAAAALAVAQRAVAADGASAEARIALAVHLSAAQRERVGAAAGAEVLAAFDAADELARTDEQRADSRHQRARALFADNLVAESLSQFELSLSADASVAQVHAGRAVCLFELGRTDESLAAFAKALGLAPADGEIRAQGEAVAAYAGKPAFFRSRQ